MNEATDHNEYTVEITAAHASRILLAAGVGMPARRNTCLLELQQRVTELFGRGAPERAEQINRALRTSVMDWYYGCEVQGQQVRRLPGI